MDESFQHMVGTECVLLKYCMPVRASRFSGLAVAHGPTC